MRTCIVSPWFLTKGGGEKVVIAIAEIFPAADHFTLFSDPREVPPQIADRMRTTFLQRIPGIFRWYRLLLPLFPLAVESMDLRGYDLVITSDANMVKCVLVDQSALHICYCHTPVRYLWDSYRQFRERSGWLGRGFFTLSTHWLRVWDFTGAQRVTHFVANSKYVAQRIRAFYGRQSTVIYPPVAMADPALEMRAGDYYLAVGRLSYTKRVDILVKACTRLGRRLIVVGAGPEESHLRSLAGPTIEFRTNVDDPALNILYAQCRALLFAADEDFGIVAIEAHAYGKPVVAFGKGGSLETVNGVADSAHRTGLYFDSQTVESAMLGIEEFERVEDQFNPDEIRKRAGNFSCDVFERTFRDFVDQKLLAHTRLYP